MRKLIAILAFIGAAALLAWALWPQPASVELGRVEMGPFRLTVEAEGKSRIREVYTVSAPVPGRVLRMNLHAGDPVKEGQTVATMTPATPAPLDARDRQMAEARRDAAQAAVDLAQAQVQQSNVQLGLAEDEFARAQKLAKQGLIPDREYARAESTLKQAETAVASAAAQLRVRLGELQSASALLDGNAPATTDCCISVTAPASGTVLRVASESEQVLAAGMPLADIGNPLDLEVVADVLSQDAVRVSVGQHAEIMDWGGPAIAASVTRVEPSAVTRVSALGIEEQRVPVVLDLATSASSPEALGHGYRVTARIVVKDVPQALVIPVAALFRRGERWFTFVARGNRITATEVLLGEMNDTLAVATSGVIAGDAVVLHPNDTLDDGDAIVPLDTR
jgi:HlyD family secretion protein